MQKSIWLFSLSLLIFFFWSCQADSRTSSTAADVHAEAIPVIPAADRNTTSHPSSLLWGALDSMVQASQWSFQGVQLAGEYGTSGPHEGYFFRVKLEQKGDSLFGTYCGGNDHRSDCGMPSQGAPDCQIRGLARGGKGLLAFESCYTGSIGLAIIDMVGPQLRWQTLLPPERPLTGIYYHAAPDDRVLKNLHLSPSYKQPARLPEVSLQTGEFLTEFIAADSHYVYQEAEVYHQVEAKTFQTRLQTGQAVRVIREAESYLMGRHGDELIEAPMYEVAYTFYGVEKKGFIRHEDLALLSFRDSRQNLFLLGFEYSEKMQPRDLGWQVIGEACGGAPLQLELPEIFLHKNRHFPFYQAKINVRNDLTQSAFSFFSLELSYQGHDPYTYQVLFAWNGVQLTSLLKPQFGLLPYDLRAAAVAEGLELQYHLLPSNRTGGQITQTYFLKHDSLHLRTAQNLEGLSLALLGENDENSFSKAWEEQAWQGILSQDGHLISVPVSLSIETKVMNDEGEVLKQVQADDGLNYHFLFQGPDWKPGYAGGFGKNKLGAGEEIALIFPDADWKLLSTGSGNTGDYRHMQVFLVGTKNGKRMEQRLHVDSFREFPVQLYWCGDLDGDKQPDFILDLSPKGFYTDWRLFLSGQAQPGELVGEAGYIPGIEPRA